MTYKSDFQTSPDPNYHENLLGQVYRILLNDQALAATEQDVLEKSKLECIRNMRSRLLLKISDLSKLKNAALSTKTVGELLTVELAALYVMYWWRRILSLDEYKKYWDDYFSQSHKRGISWDTEDKERQDKLVSLSFVIFGVSNGRRQCFLDEFFIFL